MANLKLNSHEVLTQSGDNRPEFGAGVPSGTVVQYQYIENPADDVITSTSYVDIENFFIDFTPKFSNSILHIQSTGQIGNSYGSYNNNGLRIYDSTNNFVVGNMSQMQLNTGSGQWTYSCLGIVPAINLNARIYKVQGYMSGGTNMLVYGDGINQTNDGYTCHLIIMEIAA